MNSFLSSGKRHLIITGGRQSGKSTLLSSLSKPDIITYAVKENGVFLRESDTENEARIGIFDPYTPVGENRMKIYQDGFETLGVPSVQRCIESQKNTIAIDEIGYLESGCPLFCEKLKMLFDAKNVIAAVRKQDTAFIRSILERDDVFTVDLDRPFGNTGLVIMASGLGKRFGGNKLMADLNGRPVISYILDASEGIFAKRIVVTRHESIVKLCREKGIDVILHDLPFRSDTTRLGVNAMAETDSCAFCPSDQPLLSSDTLKSLALLAANDKHSCFRPVCNETVGAPIVFPRSLYGELSELPEGKGGSYIIKKHPDMLKFLNIRDEYELMDIDTPDDLIRLEEHGC